MCRKRNRCIQYSGANANGVKELVFAGMLYASRDIVGGIDWCLANQNDENIAKNSRKTEKELCRN